MIRQQALCSQTSSIYPKFRSTLGIFESSLSIVITTYLS